MEEFDIFNLPPVTSEEKKKKERDINKLAILFISEPTDHNFENLMKRVQWGLRSFMYKILKDRDAVEDCLSRTMENIYFNRNKFDVERGKFSTWMYKIAYYNCLKYINDEFGYNSLESKTEKQIYDSVESGDTYVSGTDDTDLSNIFDIVFENGECVTYGRERILNDIYDASVKCMSRLPDNLRIVLIERYIKKKRIDDIAMDNKIPVTSVKNWLRRGIQELDRELQETSPELYRMYTEL